MSGTRRPFAWLVAPAALFVLSGPGAPGIAAADPVPGSQGTDTSLPVTESQKTLNGRGTFSGLSITVNQTSDLTNQAVSLTWSGGTPTTNGPGRFAGHYLQIFQCWGDDDGTNGANPGPPPEQCEQGGVGGTYAGLPSAQYPKGFAVSRVISRPSWPGYVAGVGAIDDLTKFVSRPFRAVDGTVIDFQTDPLFDPVVSSGSFWLNPYFNNATTNEVVAASTGPNGRGAELFQVNTGLQSPGLGCGQKVQPTADGKKIPRCWIVVVPRADPESENAGTPYTGIAATQLGVYTSPLSPNSWQNRIAFPIELKATDTPCALADVERRIAGSELVLRAVSSWQPALCEASRGLPPFSFSQVGDNAARQQIASSRSGGPGMAIVSRPLSPGEADPKSPAVYAPVLVSGVVIGFNVERNPRPEATEAEQLAGIRVAELNLTPRLVAKLLTQSYLGQIEVNNVSPRYPWSQPNPAHMGLDEDFLRFNPEFRLLQVDRRGFSGLKLPVSTSDAAAQLWEWILTDREALAWMAGQPDEWGMKVNPAYATDATINTAGQSFGTPLPSSFPKADPYCYQAPPQGATSNVTAPLLCGTDWNPYTRSLNDGARVTRLANDGARIELNQYASSSSDVWKRAGAQSLGTRAMLSVTEIASATQFGLQAARLSRANDDGSAREFIAPDLPGLTAGVAVMAARSEPTVLEPTPTEAAPGAYPLTSVAYAVVKPLSLDAAARSDYAAFLDFVGTSGQRPGFDFGELPAGYVPLPESMTRQTTAAATAVRTVVSPTAPTTTIAPATTVTAAPTTPVSTPGVAASVGGSDPAAEAEQGDPASANLPSAVAAGGNASGRASTTRPASSGVNVPSASGSTTSSVEVASQVTETTVSTPKQTTTTTLVAAGGPAPSTSVAAFATTPGTDLGRSRYAVVAFAVLGLGSALGALELTKRARRPAPSAESGLIQVHAR